MKEEICLFWDNSNIFIPARQVAGRKESLHAERSVRIHFDSLFRLACAGRKAVSGVCVASATSTSAALWQQFKETGVALELYERGRDSNREQGVDQCLQVHMLRALIDSPPKVAVLLTGDGKGFEDGQGFYADLHRMACAGWGIEVVSWDIACHRGLKEFAQAQGVYVPLEDFYHSVTFVEGGRKNRPLSLRHRGRARITGDSIRSIT